MSWFLLVSNRTCPNCRLLERVLSVCTCVFFRFNAMHWTFVNIVSGITGNFYPLELGQLYRWHHSCCNTVVFRNSFLLHVKSVKSKCGVNLKIMFMSMLVKTPFAFQTPKSSTQGGDVILQRCVTPNWKFKILLSARKRGLNQSC